MSRQTEWGNPIIENPYPTGHVLAKAFEQGVNAAREWLREPLNIDIPGYGWSNGSAYFVVAHEMGNALESGATNE